MDNILIDAMKKQNPNCYYLLNHTISPDNVICRYMDFDCLLPLLEGKLYVPRKKTFMDSEERGITPLKYYFVPTCVSDNGKEQNEVIIKRQEERNNNINNLKKSGLLLTSCWTMTSEDNYLMWKAYTNKIGVCIYTTIGQLMAAIDFSQDNYLPICSPMFYDRIQPDEDFLLSMYRKEPYYLSENELRFYFVTKDNITDDFFEKPNDIDIG